MIADAEFDPTRLRKAAARKAARPRRKPESEIVTEGIEYIRAMPYAHARKVHGSQFGNAGEPDVDAVVCGRAVKLECKAPDGGKPTAVQMAALRRWQAAGAIVGWFTNTGHVQELIDHVDDTYPEYAPTLEHPGCPCRRHQNIAL